MATTNFTDGGSKIKTIQELACSPSSADGLQQPSIYLAAVNMFLSVTAFLGNFLILVALRKESSLCPPSKLLYRCLAISDLFVGLVTQPLYATYWMSLVYEQRSLCLYTYYTAFITGFTLYSVSLLTITAISVDRLLALLLGLRYRQIVTLKRTSIITTTFWIVSVVAALCYILDHRITLSFGCTVITSCLVISITLYSKIFRTLRHQQARVQDRFQQQPGQPNALNIARYRKAVYSALWVQLALVICYAPYDIVVTMIILRKSYSSHLIVCKDILVVFAHFDSSLNPFLFCWRIGEVKQAVKQTIRQALCL